MQITVKQNGLSLRTEVFTSKILIQDTVIPVNQSMV